MCAITVDFHRCLPSRVCTDPKMFLNLNVLELMAVLLNVLENVTSLFLCISLNFCSYVDV